ncbi:MAG: thioether cross-link-forming SCIFF peptide maturase, partial [Ruminococcus sp.]
MIHKYKLCGFNIVLDVNSGAVHIVDELTYDMLENVEPPFDEKCPEQIADKHSKFYQREDIESCYQELK